MQSEDNIYLDFVYIFSYENNISGGCFSLTMQSITDIGIHGPPTTVDMETST